MKKQSCSLILSASLTLFLAACSHQPINSGLETGAIPNDEPVAAVDTAPPPSSLDETPPRDTFPGASAALAEQKTASEKRGRHRGHGSTHRSAAHRKATGRKIAKHKLDTRKHQDQNTLTVAQTDTAPTPPPPTPPQREEASTAPPIPVTVPLAEATSAVAKAGSRDWIIWTIFGLVAATVVVYHTTKGRKSDSWPHSHGV